MATVKITQKAAFQLEAGQAGAGQSPGWGQSGSEESLGANDAYPWLSWPKGKDIQSVDDNSITSEGFRDVPRKVMEHIEKPWGTPMRFDGLGSMLYWAFGFENSIVKVCAFTLSTVSVDPDPEDTYRDTDLNDFTFLRKEVWNDITYYIFRCDDAVAPTLQTGDLDAVSSSGDDPLTFTAHSDLMYEHLYELDPHTRHFVDYETAEKITGWSSGDKKNRMATVGIQMDTNDYRYKNAMCKGFNFSSTAGALAELTGELVAYDEERGDYSSSSWTTPSTRRDTDNIVAHHQLKTQLGADEDNLVDLGVVDTSIGVAIPLQVLQDTESGTHIAEPVKNGKYDITLGMTISRYSTATFQAYRDAWTSLVARVAGHYGYLMMEWLVNEVVLPNAGPDDSDVAREPLTPAVGFSSTNNWATWLTGNTLIQNSPVLLRVRNTDSSNHMFEI